jgi:hypothetical protein
MKRISPTPFLFYILFFAIIFGCKNENKQPVSEKNAIDKALQEWELNSIKNGKYAPADSCNASYFNYHEKNKKLDEGLGLPDSTKFHFLFADINSDKRLDALITFHPMCCTCTDTTGKVTQQEQITILSSEKGYSVNDSFFQNLFPDTAKIHLDIDSAASNIFFGTEFLLDKQATSMEEYQKSVSISYDTREIKFIKRKIDVRME